MVTDLPADEAVTMVVRLGDRSYPIQHVAGQQPLFWDVVRHIRRQDPDACTRFDRALAPGGKSRVSHETMPHFS